MVKNLLEAEWLTAEFQVVLDQIFARFDADDDGLWSINEELQSFAICQVCLKIRGRISRHLAAKKRRKKKEKAARQKAAKAQAAGGGSNAGASITAKVQEGGLDQVMVKLYDDRCTVSERHASSGNLAEALRVALDALKITEEFPRAHTCVGDALKAMGQADAAARSYKRADETVALIAAAAKEEAGIP
eukprot:gene10461-21729_t